MKKKMETNIMGYIGTTITIRIPSFLAAWLTKDKNCDINFQEHHFKQWLTLVSIPNPV